MKKLLVFILLLVLLVVSGCTVKSVDSNTKSVAKEDVNLEKSFYPNTVPVQKRAPAIDPVNQVVSQEVVNDFVVTQQLEAKLFLIDKYNIGICYGLPGVIPNEAIVGMIERNHGLSQFLKNKYNLATDLGIYSKIKQLNAIQLSKIAVSKYSFNFIDAQCCTLNAYRGKIEAFGQTFLDTILDQEIKNNPC